LAPARRRRDVAWAARVQDLAVMRRSAHGAVDNTDTLVPVPVPDLPGDGDGTCVPDLSMKLFKWHARMRTVALSGGDSEWGTVTVT
jgi:hypothetical protein